MDAALTGGCQCGAVRYALAAMPLRTGLCHCRMCQKAVGQPFAAYAVCRLADLTWTRRTPPAFRSSTAAERHFCPDCGTSLTFRYFHKPEIGVAVGTLDHPERVTPSAHYAVESRLPWMNSAALDGLPQEVTGDPGTPPQVLSLVNFQHPDHDTAPDWTPPAG
jgi:hypothetical protein